LPNGQHVITIRADLIVSSACKVNREFEALKKGEAALSHLIELKCQPLPFSYGNGMAQMTELPTSPQNSSGNPVCLVQPSYPEWLVSG